MFEPASIEPDEAVVVCIYDIVVERRKSKTGSLSVYRTGRLGDVNCLMEHSGD